MRKVIIIGATRSLAQYMVEALKALNAIEITLFARNNKGLIKVYHKDVAF